MADDQPLRTSDGGPVSRERRRVFVRDLVLPCRIGVHRHEQRGRQRVRINIDLEVALPAAPIGDRLGNVVDYERLASEVRAIAGSRHFNLSETLADRIVEACLADPRVHRACVRVEKLDIFSDAASVGVEVERPRL